MVKVKGERVIMPCSSGGTEHDVESVVIRVGGNV